MSKTFAATTICFFLFFQSSVAQISVSANSDTIGKYNVYELTIDHLQNYPNNWEDVTVSARFVGAGTYSISGFFYDTHIWKVRFAPPDTGIWTYALTFTSPTGSSTVNGKFRCLQSTTKGFLKKLAGNPFRLTYADGTLFNGVGFEDCLLDFNNNGTPLDDFGFDGGFYPPNTLGSRTTLTRYMTAYGFAGANFNLFRWTTDNCSFRLYNSITTSGNTYLTKEGMYGDTLVESLRANHIRIWLTLFGQPVFGNIDGSSPLEDAAIKKYINYIVARYGAYVDIWELFNESSASDYYYNTATAYIRSIDPYHRLISVSDERPALNCIDINSPHWYEKEPELESDQVAFNRINGEKSFKKPIIFGEQGNSVQNWDTLSSVRMRLRAWTSFFSEGTLIFWNTSFSKNFTAPVAANIYLGPTERGYIQALQQFTSLADTSVSIINLLVNNPSEVRSYGLNAATAVFGYFHHFETHSSKVSTSFTVRLRRGGTIFWFNPADDSLVDSTAVSYGTQTIVSPQFYTDVAMYIKLSDKEPIFDEREKLDLIIYPNPGSSEFAVSANFNGTVLVQLFTLNGKKVFEQNGVYNDEKLDIQSLKKGVYICKVINGSRTSTSKLIISR